MAHSPRDHRGRRERFALKLVALKLSFDSPAPPAEQVQRALVLLVGTALVALAGACARGEPLRRVAGALALGRLALFGHLQ